MKNTKRDFKGKNTIKRYLYLPWYLIINYYYYNDPFKTIALLLIYNTIRYIIIRSIVFINMSFIICSAKSI